MNLRSWLLVLIGCLVLLVSLRDRNRGDDSATDGPARAGEPDLYMQHASITQYDEAGGVRYRLGSAEVHHYATEGLTRLSEPTLQLNRAPQPPWFARAREALISDPGDPKDEVILLREDVHLEQHEPNRTEIVCRSLRR